MPHQQRQQSQASHDDTTLHTSTSSPTARAIVAAFAALSISHGTALDSAQAHSASDQKAGPIEREESPQVITSRLLERPISLEVRSASLEQIVGALSASVGLPIEALWDSPRFPGGLSPQTEISFSATKLPLRAALERLADQITGSDNSVTWQVLQDGRLQFGTKESLNQYKERRIYDVQDLLFQYPNFSNAPKFDMNAALQQGRGGGGSAIIGDPGESKDALRSKTSAAESLKALLLTTVEADQWQENGGSGGSIQMFRNSFIINAAPYVHRALR